MATQTSSSARHCTHCPEPGADVCIRAEYAARSSPSTGSLPTHIYAHRACAAERGELPLYTFTNASSTPPAATG